MMKKDLFDIMFEQLIGVEGGFTDDPRDRGNWTSGKIGIGELKGTKYGVSAMSYPDLDIKNIDLDTAKNIFRADYWDKCKAVFLPDPIAAMVTDTAYHSGPSRAIKILQQTLFCSQDGIIGNVTLSVANRANLKQAIETYTENRINYLKGIKSWKDYGKGWTNRVNHMKDFCLSLIEEA